MLAIGTLAPGRPCKAQRSPGAVRATSAWFKDSRAELAMARARGDTNVTLVVVAVPHRVREVARAIVRIGGSVQVQDDDLDYLCVRTPLSRAEQVGDIVGVEAAAVSVLSRWGGRVYTSADDASSGPSKAHSDTTDNGAMTWPPPASRYPFEHPYSPLMDLDAATWRAEHPTWDGRGATIADLEGTPDMLAPELQTGIALDGRPVPKYVDIYSVDIPDRPAGAPTARFTMLWLPMRDTVVAHGHRLQYHGRAYVTPSDGRFRIDVVNERALRAWRAWRELKGNLHRDGKPPGADSLFAVLWDERRNTVWVDTDQTGDFTSAHPMTDYAVHFDVGAFGRDDPRTPIRESVGFTVQTDPVRHAVALNLGVDSHSTAVQGAAAGARGPNGHFDGIAPGARLVSINYGIGSAAMFADALIRAFKDPRIDIVVLEPNAAVIDETYVLRDGRFPVNILSDRLIERYQKPLLVPADNNTGLGAVSEDASARETIGVGAYQSYESYRVNDGVLTAASDNLHIVGAGGPGGDGSLKPDVLAPSQVLSSSLGYASAGGEIPGLYQLPPGYIISGGTSTAAPIAAGAVALLVSAAKQAGIPYTAARIRRALFLSARHLDNVAAFEQGNGLIRVAAAWDALVKMARDPDAGAPVAITVRAPVHHALSTWLAVPDEGSGLYETDGWTVGQRAERTLTLTRTAGPSSPMALAMRWIGNDGTFISATTVSLPRGKPVQVPITVAPVTRGAHTAVLELEDPANGTAVRRVSCVIIVPDSFPAPTYALSLQDSVPRPGRRNLFFRVPPGAGALTFDFSNVTGALMGALYRPDGRMRSLGSGTVDSAGGLRYVPMPEPGVWELALLGDWRTFHADQQPGIPLAAVRFTLKASVVGAEVAGVPDTGTGGTWAAITAHSAFGPLSAAVVTAPLATGYAAQDHLKPHAQRVYSVEVPPGSGLLLASVTPVDPTRADLDLYLFDCTNAPCVPAAASADTGAAAAIAYPRPAPGTWRLVVDAARLTGDSIGYKYLDLVLNPRYGTTSVADPGVEQRQDETWRAQVHIWQAEAIVAPRQPYAVFTVEDERLREADGKAALPSDRVPLAWTAVPLTRAMSAHHSGP